MSVETYGSLYIVRGEPFRPGTCVSLSDDSLIVGRLSKENTPEVAFTNAFVSRKHLLLRRELDQVVLVDLGSRHGTEINGVRLAPHTPYTLRSFDIIRLAKGMVVLHFSHAYADQTIEFEPLSYTRQWDLSEQDRTTVNWEKRECLIQGKRIPMSEKEYLLLRLLHDHPNRLVPNEEIKRNVWSERARDQDGIPDVTIDELNALVYRIRKKYGKDTFCLNTVRGSGIMLETETAETPSEGGHSSR
ncbi:FHA domain-containing protein [Paenibacillus sp. y28]|uniref:FHA domain-containing protein n=1 Tax=Paenibacillus sp. y28 TaxID=3129110 RepID=UPI003018E93D